MAGWAGWAARAAGRRAAGERGMTLVELMVALIAMSLVVGAIYSILMTSFQVFGKSTVTSQAQQGGRLAIDRISRELRQARRLISSQTSGGFTFNLGGSTCTQTNPQISFVLPHYATVTLSDGTQAYIADPNASGQIPYDGAYVSYYLSATKPGTPGGPVLNTSGPYLYRTSYDVVAAPASATTTVVASNITKLDFVAAGACPTGGVGGSRAVTVTLTATQTQTNQNVTGTDAIAVDVALRNPP